MVDIKFFDQNGMDIGRVTERKIENTFFRKLQKSLPDEIGLIYYEPRVPESYTDGFVQALENRVTRPYRRL